MPAHRWATEAHKGKTFATYAEADAERLAELLPTLAERHGLVIVDTAGFGNQAAAVAMAAADVVLVPLTPGEADLVEAQRTVSYVTGLSRSVRRNIDVRVVLNRVRRGTMLSRHLLTELEGLALARCETTLSEAVAFGEFGFSGQLPPNSTSALEVATLLAELQRQFPIMKPLRRKTVKA